MKQQRFQQILTVPVAIVLIMSLLSGCASITTQFIQMAEPADGARARVRVVANMLVKGVPESSCLDWSKPGAGTILVESSAAVAIVDAVWEYPT